MTGSRRGQLGLEKFVARGDAAAFHIGAVVGATQAKFGVATGFAGSLPRFAAAGDEVPDVHGVDAIERVFLFGVGERDAERAAAGEPR